jgi:phosphatidylserine decarboxylase precursor-related protein
MVSPADGRISAIERVDQHPATDGPAVIVRIFLSVLDVHVNRAPCGVTVEKLIYTPGKYLDARSEESARVNESNLIVMSTDSGTRIGLRCNCPSDRLSPEERGSLEEGTTVRNDQVRIHHGIDPSG